MWLLSPSKPGGRYVGFRFHNVCGDARECRWWILAKMATRAKQHSIQSCGRVGVQNALNQTLVRRRSRDAGRIISPPSFWFDLQNCRFQPFTSISIAQKGSALDFGFAMLLSSLFHSRSVSVQ